MKIYLMRHGETYWNHLGYIQGSSDIELTPYGIELAEKTRDGFAKDGIRFDRIYTSPYKRALKTAEIINEKQHAPLIKDDRIREMSFGVYEGQNIEELKKTDENIRFCFSLPSKYVPKEGETFAEVSARMKDFFEHEIRPLEGICDTILITCHGAFIRTVLTWIKQQPLDSFWSANSQPNCCVNLLTLTDGTFQVEKEGILYYEPSEKMKRGIL